jgi:hypothetical protein
MKKDPMWSVFLDYCRENGFWYGERIQEVAQNQPDTGLPPLETPLIFADV